MGFQKFVSNALNTLLVISTLGPLPAQAMPSPPVKTGDDAKPKDVCAVVIVRDDRSKHASLMTSTIKDGIEKAGFKGRILIYETDKDEPLYTEEQAIIDQHPNTPVIINQSFGGMITAEMVINLSST